MELEEPKCIVCGMDRKRGTWYCDVVCQRMSFYMQKDANGVLCFTVKGMEYYKQHPHTVDKYPILVVDNFNLRRGAR